MTLSIYQLKPKFQQLLKPLLVGLANRHITPNQVTLLATFLSVLYGSALAFFPDDWRLWAGLPAFMLLRMALNAIDGMLATATNQKTRLGAVLNEVCDQVSDAALMLPFALVAGLSAPLIVLAAVLALLTEFAGVLAVSIGAPRGFEGPMGKSDRAFAFAVLALLIAIGSSAIWLNSLTGVILLLLSWTLINRLRQALAYNAPPTP